MNLSERSFLDLLSGLYSERHHCCLSKHVVSLLIYNKVECNKLYEGV